MSGARAAFHWSGSIHLILLAPITGSVKQLFPWKVHICIAQCPLFPVFAVDIA
jgi:hypothetical protein